MGLVGSLDDKAKLLLATTSANNCHLIAGTFATFLQFLLGLFAISTLVYKRSVETPRRPLDIWLMDVSKQVLSSFVIHFWNIGLSILFANSFLITSADATADVAQSSSGADECSFYFLSFVFDTILGVFLVWVLLKVNRQIATLLQIESIQIQGYYSNPPKLSWYLQQLVCFLVIILISKIILGLMMYSVASSLEAIGSVIFAPLKLHPNTELVVVMIICPCFLNIIQYWLQDNFLMDKDDPLVSHKRIEREQYAHLGEI